MKITAENLSKINFHGLVLTFSTVADPEKAGKLHQDGCAAAKQTRKIFRMESDVVENVLYMLDRQYGVTLCPCARFHKDMK